MKTAIIDIEEIVSVLNKALEEDPYAINTLFANRIECNNLDTVPFFVRHHAGGVLSLGVLGLINGILPKEGKEGAISAITAEGESCIVGSRIHKFIVTPTKS